MADHNPGASLHSHGCCHSVFLSVCLTPPHLSCPGSWPQSWCWSTWPWLSSFSLSVCLTPPHLSHVQVADHNPGAGLHGHGCCNFVYHCVFLCLSVCLSVCLTPPHLSCPGGWPQSWCWSTWPWLSSFCLSVCLTPPHLSHVQVADHNPGAGLHGHGCRHSVCLSVSPLPISLMSRWLTTIPVLVYMAMVVVTLSTIVFSCLSICLTPPHLSCPGGWPQSWCWSTWPWLSSFYSTFWSLSSAPRTRTPGRSPACNTT